MTCVSHKKEEELREFQTGFTEKYIYCSVSYLNIIDISLIEKYIYCSVSYLSIIDISFIEKYIYCLVN